jgi:hypothetical protein
MDKPFAPRDPIAHGPVDGTHLTDYWRAACLRDADAAGPGMVPAGLAACRDAAPGARGWPGARTILQPDGKIMFHDGGAWRGLQEDAGW